MSGSRDAAGEIIAYNKPLTEAGHKVAALEGPAELTQQALRRKLDALAATPFQFFRGTFHLMAWDLYKLRVPLAEPVSPEGLIVGDLHLENFGIYRGQSGELTFDVNDFDDVGYGPLDVDLKRLCTSALLLPGLAPRVRQAASKAIAKAWAAELAKLGGRFPIPAWGVSKAEGRVRTLLEGRKQKSRPEMIVKCAPAKGHDQLEQGDKFVRPARPWVETVKHAVDGYLKNLEQLKAPNAPAGWKILDTAYRFKGLGSLGRLRFTVLLGHDNERRLVELKEARPSAMDDARGRQPLRDRGRVQTASIRRLQADPWPRVAATAFGPIAALGRENEPEEEKVGSDRFAEGDSKHEELNAYASQCGQVLARLHVRENAPAILGTHWDINHCAQVAVDFAEKYALQVEADQKSFAKAKPEVIKALNL
ncbi:MAG TPA: DUF2252 family protein [Myxococcales bacterium]|nr:DUF2252 family protein [Myxococcales bacterium]